MIELTKLNGAPIAVNPDLIRTVSSTPDTLVTFTDGETLMVRETVREVTAKFLNFKRSLNRETPAWT